MHKKIVVGARASPLSQAQVAEVLAELQRYHPSVYFEPIFVASGGDIDKTTSLRSLGKTNFFTKEIDDMLLNGSCQIAIHSAKDLPEPIPEGLVIAALTRGLDSADALVMRPNESLESLPVQAKIATSSGRREQAVRNMRNDFCYMDIRGTIQERLHKLDTGEADGVVVAEAALIRLKLTHLNRIKLPGVTTLFQGQLAVLTTKDNIEMMQLLRCLDCRQNESN